MRDISNKVTSRAFQAAQFSKVFNRDREIAIRLFRSDFLLFDSDCVRCMSERLYRYFPGCACTLPGAFLLNRTTKLYTFLDKLKNCFVGYELIQCLMLVWLLRFQQLNSVMIIIMHRQ